MYVSSICIVICSLIATALGAPALEDIFAGFVKNANLNSPSGKADVVKRRIYEENSDASLKQISLQSLIGGLEDSLFQSAISVSRVASDGGEVPDIRPGAPELAVTEHSLIKRNTAAQTSDNAAPLSGSAQHGIDATTEPEANSRKIILQTTEKVPEAGGVPAHILIDRITVQPHAGHNIPLIPAFQLHQTKVVAATIKENQSGPPTHITITKTDIKATGELSASASGDAKSQLPALIIATNPNTVIAVTPSVDHAADTLTPTTGTKAAPALAEATTESAANGSPTSTTTTATPTTSTTTTKLPIVQLKEAEEELKEKVAEIEADPVILSSRV